MELEHSPREPQPKQTAACSTDGYASAPVLTGPTSRSIEESDTTRRPIEVSSHLLESVRNYQALSGWEKSELGREMRREGLSYGEIMDLIPVKKSTLATWCREVTLTDDQIASIKQRQAQIPGISRDTNRKRRLEIDRIRRRAASDVAWLVRDPKWVAGTVLYWAEGTKTRNKLSVANTDPQALRLFIAWVRDYLMPDAEFRLALHLHEGNDERAAQDWWRGALSLPDSNFHKTFIKPKGTGHRKNVHKHGVCTVRTMRPADAWQTAMSWIEALPSHLASTSAISKMP